MAKNFLKSSLENASLNIILQISFRIVTFILNAFVIRHVSQDAIGVMYVRLLLLESTILTLSRLAFRKACISKTDTHNWPQVINLIWLTVPLGVITSLIFGYIWLNVLSRPEDHVTQHYTFGVISIAASCVIEMCSDSLYLVSQAFLFVKLRIFAELIQIFVRTVIFVLLILKSAEHAVLAFSIAQLVSLMAYVVFFYVYFYWYIRANNRRRSEIKKDEGTDDFPFHSMVDFLPKRLQNSEQIDWKLLILTWSFMKQSVMMQILTEGERYVMTLINVLSFSEQGVFDVVNNLGSLAARFLFRPIEESAYFYFSQLIHRDVDIRKQNKSSMDEAAHVLENLLRCVSSLGLLVLFFGQSYAKMALLLYGGRNLAFGLGAKLLKTHCVAILLMAINGSTECYALSTMNTTELNKYNRIMIIFSVSFLIASWLFSSLLGSVGFIVANCCNMLARIIYCSYFIKRRYKNTRYKPLFGLIPKIWFFITLFVSAIVTFVSEVYLFDEHLIVHFFIGAVLFLITVASWMYQEKELVGMLVQNWKKKRE
ncbi:protein RFT1 homolog [Planococcus citri]|uniref:protein RFT1 homolog n=1 Tax=Planococcus citri TaxID=170843 RepID=UPI0031F80D27